MKNTSRMLLYSPKSVTSYKKPHSFCMPVMLLTVLQLNLVFVVLIYFLALQMKNSHKIKRSYVHLYVC